MKVSLFFCFSSGNLFSSACPYLWRQSFPPCAHPHDLGAAANEIPTHRLVVIGEARKPAIFLFTFFLPPDFGTAAVQGVMNHT